MKYASKFLVAALVCAALSVPSGAGATTASDLSARIDALMAQLAALQASTAGSQSGPYTGPTGTYEMTFGNGGHSHTEGITEAEARDNCALNTRNNPNTTVKCTWNGKDISAATTQTGPVTSTGIQIDIVATPRIVLESASGGIAYVRVYGLPSVIRTGLISGNYRADFALEGSDGKGILLNGNFEDETSIPDGGRAVLFLAYANPNYSDKTLPAGTYKIKLIVYKYGATDPHTFLIATTKVVDTTGDSIRLPLSSASSAVTLTLAPPSCTLTATPSSAKLGTYVKVSWTSQNAKKAAWVPDTSGKDNLTVPSSHPSVKGSRKFKMTVLGNPFLTMQVTAKDGTTATCKVVIPVTS